MSEKYDDKPAIAFIKHEPKKTTLAFAIKPMTKTAPKTAILSELESEVPGKITKVRSCSDCCMMYNPDGTPNTVGEAFRKAQEKTVSNIHGTYTYQDCAHCPIHLNLTEEEWQEILDAMDGTE